MGFWSDLGSSIATSGGDIATNTIGGIINAGLNRALGDYERQKNYEYNEKAAANADRRARAQFRDMYSYSAQVQEMKKAGLNPALMYGGASGQGGATAPQGMGAGGVQKGLSGMNLMSLAEIEVMKSQANLNNAEAQKVGEETTGQQIENYINELVKDTSVEERRENLKVLVALGQKYLSEATKNQSDAAYIDWKRGFEELKSNEELTKIKNENALLLAKALTEGSQKQLNDQETKTLTAQVDKWQMDVYQRFYELDIASWNQEAQENWWNSQSENLVNRLEFDCKKFEIELDWNKKQTWINAGVEIGKSIIVTTGSVLSARMGGLPSKEVSTETIVNGKGQMTTKSRTTSRH